jgi:hypothetical protein
MNRDAHARCKHSAASIGITGLPQLAQVLARSPPFERWLSQKTELPVAPSPSNAKFLERERYILTLSG